MERNKIVTIADAEKNLGLHFTTNHNGKMRGMQSLSTSCLENPICQARQKNQNLICSHCYAERQMRMFQNMEACFKRNTEILTSKVLDKDELPLINAAFFRFESFGDICNEAHVINFFNLCNKNKKVNFALWTKNPRIIRSVISDGHKKPRNLQIVYSSPVMNRVEHQVLEEDYIDKVFTVFSKDYIEEHKININCGDKCCLECHKCYVKSSEVYINEKLK